MGRRGHAGGRGWGRGGGDTQVGGGEGDTRAKPTHLISISMAGAGQKRVKALRIRSPKMVRKGGGGYFYVFLGESVWLC